MLKIVSRILYGILIVCLLIMLTAPESRVTSYAIAGVVTATVMLVVFFMIELICMLGRIRPGDSWRPGNPDQVEGRLHRGDSDDDGWTDDLVDGTAMGLIDWDE